MDGMPTLNNSGISPVEYCVLVEPREIDRKTKGGLMLPDEIIERKEFARVEGILIAKSPMAFQWDDWPSAAASLKPQVGQRVVFSKYNADQIQGRDGKTYWIMRDKSIIAVMENENE